MPVAPHPTARLPRAPAARRLPLLALAAGLLACSSGTRSHGPRSDDAPALDPNLQLQLIPQPGQRGPQIVNFAIPLPPGLASEPRVRVRAGTTELPTYRRGLGAHPDGSLRAIQVQIELTVDAALTLDVEVGGPSSGAARPGVDVADTLITADGTQGPKVWVLLPARWLASAGFAGDLVAQPDLAGTDLDAWGQVCDYQRWDTAAFTLGKGHREAWLFDRPTALYRGYAITGALAPLSSAYREAALYRAGITGTGAATRIAIPDAADDLKYHYPQGLTLHWLLTGDDRFRATAEDLAIRAHDLWPDPGYAGGDDFWTERHAGFALLAYEWAAIAAPERAATYHAWADTAVDAYLQIQATYPPLWRDPTARCFAHSATAHGETFGYDGCSPWMSAILADGLHLQAQRTSPARAERIATSLVALGRIIARDGRDPTGRPYYWMGIGRTGEPDDHEEHWGEAAYLTALAWHHSHRTDPTLATAARELLAGLRTRGQATQVRSFNWQCRTAVQAPAYLR